MTTPTFAALPHQDWADLVFHVLAHVEATAHLPSSLYDPRYVAFCEKHLGAAAERQLGEDAQVLGTLLLTHEALASVQRLAWLHDGIVEGARSEGKLLSELEPSEVSKPALLGALREDRHDTVEVLRCAVALERPHFEKLPPAQVSSDAQAELLQRIDELSAIAPLLTRTRIVFVRALGVRGRVWGNEIWLGIPGAENGPTAEHAAWQAAHEATVSEVSAAAAGGELGLGERDAEVAALVLLSRRAHAAGQSDAHRRWFATVSTQADPEAILEHARLELDSLLRRFGS